MPLGARQPQKQPAPKPGGYVPVAQRAKGSTMASNSPGPEPSLTKPTLTNASPVSASDPAVAPQSGGYVPLALKKQSSVLIEELDEDNDAGAGAAEAN